MSAEPIPLVDLKAQHAEIADEVAAGFARVFEQSSYILGGEVPAFELDGSERFFARHLPW